jgi:hypothetical protein
MVQTLESTSPSRIDKSFPASSAFPLYPIPSPPKILLPTNLPLDSHAQLTITRPHHILKRRLEHNIRHLIIVDIPCILRLLFRDFNRRSAGFRAVGGSSTCCGVGDELGLDAAVECAETGDMLAVGWGVEEWLTGMRRRRLSLLRLGGRGFEGCTPLCRRVLERYVRLRSSFRGRYRRNRGRRRGLCRI